SAVRVRVVAASCCCGFGCVGWLGAFAGGGRGGPAGRDGAPCRAPPKTRDGVWVFSPEGREPSARGNAPGTQAEGDSSPKGWENRRGGWLSRSPSGCTVPVRLPGAALRSAPG